MDTNKVQIGDVITVETKSQKGIGTKITKEGVLLYQKPDGTFLDLDTNDTYYVGPNRYLDVGDSFVLKELLKPFTGLLTKPQQEADMPKSQIKSIYRLVSKKTK